MTESLTTRIAELKAARNAVILVHNYQPAEVQDIADFLGDSLELSRKAADTTADVIVFCGVHFMAETAAILSPDRVVLLPDAEAGCPMADMIDAAQLREIKAKHPGAAVVCYVNSTAAVKAESDCCCTSANAVDVVRSFSPEQAIIFVPDKHLGDYAAQQSGRPLILWPGYCPTHVRIRPEDILQLKREHPDAIAMAHPECPRPTRDAADRVLSTGGMCRLAREAPEREFIVATESGILHRCRKENPDKIFYPVSETCICPNMKKITLAKVLWALEDLQPRIEVPETVRLRAKGAIDRMLALKA